jgi:hypothetical protein
MSIIEIIVFSTIVLVWCLYQQDEFYLHFKIYQQLHYL